MPCRPRSACGSPDTPIATPAVPTRFRWSTSMTTSSTFCRMNGFPVGRVRRSVRGPWVGGGDNWISGNPLFDRDVYGSGDYGDFGVSMADGRIAFGVNNGTDSATLCGVRQVADGMWRHIALTRRTSDGWMRIYVDGELDAEIEGPAGDISYRNGRTTTHANDPYLVVGAEKHDAGAAYPSDGGWAGGN